MHNTTMVWAMSTLIADQLCVFYRLDHWMRNKKWWWSITIMFWSLGVTLTNSYVVYYSTMCDKDGVIQKKGLIHTL